MSIPSHSVIAIRRKVNPPAAFPSVVQVVRQPSHAPRFSVWFGAPYQFEKQVQLGQPEASRFQPPLSVQSR
jgi:hypothetical protein